MQQLIGSAREASKKALPLYSIRQFSSMTSAGMIQ